MQPSARKSYPFLSTDKDKKEPPSFMLESGNLHSTTKDTSTVLENENSGHDATTVLEKEGTGCDATTVLENQNSSYDASVLEKESTSSPISFI